MAVAVENPCLTAAYVARALLAAVLVSDRWSAEAAAVVAELPEAVWPDHITRVTAGAIKALVLAGKTADLSGVLAELDGSTPAAEQVHVHADLSCEIIGTTPTCDPERDAETLRNAHAARKFAESKRRLGLGLPDMSRHELRHFLADSSLLEHEESVDDLPFSDLTDWQRVAGEPLNLIFEEGLLRGTLGVVSGESGTGKSFLGLELALALALGRPLVRGFSPARLGSILGLFGEDPVEVLAKRMAAVCGVHGLRVADIDAIIADGRLTVVAGWSAPVLDFDRSGTATETATYARLLNLCRGGFMT